MRTRVQRYPESSGYRFFLARLLRTGRLFHILAVFLLLSPAVAPQERPVAPRMGIWVVRHNLLSPSGIDSVYAFAERHGFTDLFLQVRGRGDAYFRSELEPPPPGLNADFDPLDYILNHPARERFVIHAWVKNFHHLLICRNRTSILFNDR